MSELVLYHGDCIDVLRRLDAESVDAVVTDPPYGLEFMGKEWDSFRVDDPAGHHRHRGEHAGDHGEQGAQGADTPGARSRISYGGGRRARTHRCVSCGKRDQFRQRHHPCGDGVWRAELIDPHAAPPTMLAFQEWCRTWAIECLRVLKPGGYMLAFGGTRTYHRLVSGVEDAGFEIRDTVAWLYGQGFPKSLDVAKAIDARLGAERAPGTPGQWAGRESVHDLGLVNDDAWQGGQPREATSPATPEAARWQGWGTALKPAHEPIVVARKPLQGSVAANVLEHGTGGLNIDATRIPVAEGDPVLDGVWTTQPSSMRPDTTGFLAGTTEPGDKRSTAPPEGGRWPPNVAMDETAAAMLDAQTGELKAPTISGGKGMGYRGGDAPRAMIGRADAGGASRFFYVAKAGGGERNRGLGHLEAQPGQLWNEGGIKASRELTAKPKANVHPTVKPLDLMHWLVRLVTPPGGVVLDPFAGSGTTGVACRLEHVRCILIERDAEYLPIIAGRLGVTTTPVGEMRLERTRIPEPERQARRGATRFGCPHCSLAFTDRSLYARHWRARHDPRRPPTKEPDDA